MSLLRIRTIARLTGIREATLRAWERRYGFPRPHRSENNYRAYTREEVENIRRVARFIEEGLSVSEAISQVKALPVRELPPEGTLSERFWAATKRMDTDEALRVLDEGQAAMDVDTYCEGLLLPLLREMGERVDIAREHLASALIRQRLSALLAAEGSRQEGPRAVLACPARDHHEGGLLALGLFLKRRGWRVTVLGADTPAEALHSACAQVAPDLVALSFVRRREPEEMVQVLREAVQACAPVLVVAGGPGAREHLKAIFSCGAQYAETASELMALWQQARGAPNGT
ncbi:DNA-binding transcriptional regulator, MerR family [Stigmatella aurantiaca]|uniref:DNA-binding transcriptional regulator, MerR family n=1 Tax=Stigmatella aurantiaca TaxID=41 RepID=A0A1H8B8J0_STIAU|nr:MerR family transcriptional regulator [Stigmatella aurantiaca]SEM79271.1 DNA-binding transcriptional regulator, MerR family [Stigmatella aurantiaca]